MLFIVYSEDKPPLSGRVYSSVSKDYGKMMKHFYFLCGKQFFFYQV